MGLTEIDAAGVMAQKLRRAGQSMNSIYNQHKADYAELLAAIQSAYGLDKTMSTMTDTEVGDFFFGALKDAAAIANAQIILKEWEKNTSTLAGSVAALPANDI